MPKDGEFNSAFAITKFAGYNDEIGLEKQRVMI